MRIAIFSEVYWPMVSGVSLTLQRLVEAMADSGHACRVYAPAYDRASGMSDRPEIHRSPAQPLFLYRDVNWAFPRTREITEDFARFSPDVVHVATEFAMGVTGMRLARQFDVPIIASAHTDYERYASRYLLDWLMPAGWRYLQWFYGNAATVLCPSRVYERHLQRRGIGHTAIWSRGVDSTQFSPRYRADRFRAELGIPTGAPLVLYVGRLAAEKNLLLLLEAWRGLVADGSEARLVLVGTGPLRDEIAAAPSPQVTLAGVRTGTALAEAYASADVFAFPSSTETFGNVLLEAMASGLPSLAVRAGGVLDFAEHGRNAWLVEPESVGALRDGIARLLTDHGLRAHLVDGAMATATSRDWASIFDGVESTYRAVIRPAALPRAA